MFICFLERYFLVTGDLHVDDQRQDGSQCQDRSVSSCDAIVTSGNISICCQGKCDRLQVIQDDRRRQFGNDRYP